MTEFQELKDNIREEIKDAEKYIRLALEHKADNPKRAAVYKTLAEAELEHMETLHDLFEREIREWKENTGHEPSPEMMGMYKMLHEIAQEDADRVRGMIQAYKQP